MTWLQRITLPAIVLLALIPLGAQAGDTPPQGAPGSGCGPSTITSGSGDVVVEGKQAARAGDTTGCGNAVVEGWSNVFVNGKPAAMQGSDTGCGGSIVSGSSGVFINGKPMARTGDQAGCAGK